MRRVPAIFIRLGLTLAFILGGFAAMKILIATAPQPQQRPAERVLPVVEPLQLQLQSYRVTLPSQGIVLPRTRTQLAAEVSGKITAIADNFLDGALFQEGERLLELDARDYETARTRAEAALVRAQTALEVAEAQTEKARDDWKRLGKGNPSPLALKMPQLKEARANLISAEADLADAQLNIERCRIVAPYTGRIVRKNVDIGQYVNPGMLLGEIFATGVYEVRLPLRNDQLGFLPPFSAATRPAVALFGESDRNRSWTGEVERTDAEVDSRSRQLFVIATIRPDADAPPLPSGTFVEAEIEGIRLEDVLLIPRASLRGKDTVLRLTPDNNVAFHRLDVLYAGDPDYIVAAPQDDLPAGSRISLTQLPFIGDGDPVVIRGETPLPLARGQQGQPENRPKKRSSS